MNDVEPLLLSFLSHLKIIPLNHLTFYTLLGGH